MKCMVAFHQTLQWYYGKGKEFDCWRKEVGENLLAVTTAQYRISNNQNMLLMTYKTIDNAINLLSLIIPVTQISYDYSNYFKI